MSGTQTNWRWCYKCQGLWFAGNGTAGECPASEGGHGRIASGDYHPYLNWDEGGQHGWRWCAKCQGMWFAGNGTSGHCPQGDGHSTEGSGDYVLGCDYTQSRPDSGATLQSDWRWCRKCQGLFFAGNERVGACPAGDQHDSIGSGDYRIYQHEYEGSEIPPELDEEPPPEQPPQIAVIRVARVFRLTGVGFVPGESVDILVSDNRGGEVQYTVFAGAAGTIRKDIALACEQGNAATFVAVTASGRTSNTFSYAC